VTDSLVSSVNVSPSEDNLVINSVTLPAPTDTSLGHKPLILVKIEWNIRGSSNWEDDGGDLPEFELYACESGTSTRIDAYYYTHPKFNDISASYEKFSATLIAFSDTAITTSKTFDVKANLTSFDTQPQEDKVTISKCDFTVIGVR